MGCRRTRLRVMAKIERIGFIGTGLMGTPMVRPAQVD
jgi:hypothetical protein